MIQRIKTLRRELVTDYLTQLVDEAQNTLDVVKSSDADLNFERWTLAMQLLGCMSANLASVQNVMAGRESS